MEKENNFQLLEVDAGVKNAEKTFLRPKKARGKSLEQLQVFIEVYSLDEQDQII